MMETYIVTVYEKFSDTAIVFNCQAESEAEIVKKYKLTDPDILSFKIVKK